MRLNDASRSESGSWETLMGQSLDEIAAVCRAVARQLSAGEALSLGRADATGSAIKP